MSEWFPYYNPFAFGLHFLIGILVGSLLTYSMKYSNKNSILFDGLWLIVTGILIAFLWKIRGAGDFSYSLFHTPFHFPIVAILFGLIVLITPSTRWIAPF